MAIFSRKLSFSLPARFRDEATIRAILVTFGAKILSLECTIKNDEQVFGYCRFNTAEEAAQIGGSLNGLRIGDFTVETAFEEETNEDLIDKVTPSAASTKPVIKEKKPPPRNASTNAAMEEHTVARKKPGPKPKPKSIAVEDDKKKRVKMEEKPTNSNVRVKKVVVSSSDSEDEKEKKLTASKKDVPIPTTHFPAHKDCNVAKVLRPTASGEEELHEQSEAEEEMKSVVEKSKAQKTTVEEEVWEEYLDDRYGVPYYFNPATKETTWELPPTASRIVKASPTPATTPSVAAAAASSPSATATTTTPAAAVVEEEQQQPIVERQHSAPISVREPQHHHQQQQQSSYHHHQSVMPRAKEHSSSNAPLSSSVPHRIDTKRGASTEVFSGTIANIKQGFGFINCNTSNLTNRADLFFHFDELVEPTSVFFPKKGDEVEFELSFNHNRGQSIAVRVRRPNRGITSSSAASSSHVVPLARSVSHPTPSSALPQSSRHRSRHNLSQQRSNSRLRSRSPQTGSGGGGSMNMLRRSASDGYSGGSSHAPSSRGWSRDHHHHQSSSSTSSSMPLPQQQTWVRYTDRKTNLPYWHCPATNETTWTNPE